MATSFKFTRVDSFLDDMNREDCFDTSDMDGVTPNYRFLLASECGDTISECVDEDGTLNTDNVEIIDYIGAEDGYCALMWGKGINGERSISVATPTITYDFGDEEATVKGIFLVAIADGTGYVLAYSILDKIYTFEGSLIMPTDGLLWSMRYG